MYLPPPPDYNGAKLIAFGIYIIIQVLDNFTEWSKLN